MLSIVEQPKCNKYTKSKKLTNSMQIFINYDNNRILLNDNLEEINISDNNIIQYTGYYYKLVNDIVKYAKIKTIFIGIIESERYNYETGINGIYVKLLYIWSDIDSDWFCVKYEEPLTKYFLYPHLLSLPYLNENKNPLYFLNTCKNINIEDFTDITKEYFLKL